MDNRDSGLFAFLLGAVVGAAAALLYAPKTGKETRAHLKKLTEDFVEDAGEVGTDLKEKGKKFVAESKTKVSEFVEKGKARYSKAFKKQAPAVEEEVAPVEEKSEDLIQE
ncbi:YtxH domain-containing protein [Candidatus Ruminimicrobiellum ovillum]|uniref:YtxH domain-containing protein n=1 Tax=Candidatus Ruminimicrobiellum ovillum TaxID=1947927 RepID=UPI00355A8B5B